MLLLILLLTAVCFGADAFVLPQKKATSILRATPAREPVEGEQTAKSKQLTSLWSNVQSALWPGVKADPTVPEPLPPGSLGCPFFGSDSFLSGNKKDGPGFFFKQASARAGHPSLFKFYFLGTPVVSVSGAKQYQQISFLEFSHIEALSPTYNDGQVDESQDVPNVFGNDSILFERNKEKHALLRRLVGGGMTAAAVKDAYPSVQQIAQERIETLFKEERNLNIARENIKMEKVCTDYTMDITMTQILGLQLPPEEVAVFREKLTLWLKALYSPIANLNIPWIIRHIPEYKARKYMEAKIRDRMNYLKEHGPDVSVLSNMVFAVDEEQGVKLTSKEIVENALFLIAAGSETSSGTLTLMMLLLGLHPEKYHSLVQEQRDVQSKFGETLSPDILDNHCHYLNAVMKETMRMGPMTGSKYSIF
jgi:cytochrome P450